MNKCKIKVTDIQVYETHKDKNETVVEATVATRNGSTYITYKQLDEEAGQQVTTLIKLKDGIVKVKRSGTFTTELIFDMKKNYETTYRTPYGEMNIGVNAKEVKYNVADEAVYLKLDYALSIDQKVVSKNIYRIDNI